MNLGVELGRCRDEVLAALDNPIRVVPAQGGRLEAQGWIERGPKRLLLRVIYEGTLVISVVTVVASSRFEKYGVKP